MTYVTNHGEKRLRKRSGINKKSVERIAEKAYRNGLHHKDTTGRLNRWISKLYFTNKRANSIRIYGDKAYIFADDVLITVFQVPKELIKIVEDNKQKKIIREN